MNVLRRNYSILLSIFLLANCTTTYTGDHPWLNPSPPSEGSYWSSDDYIVKYRGQLRSIVQYNQYYVNADIMNDKYKDKYISLLQAREYVEITQEEANRIAINNFTGNSKKYLVVRAVYTFFPEYPSRPGTYNILLSEKNDLFVYYTVMGDRRYEVEGDALIIEVETIPNNFYVSYSVAE
ncbi:hypothetical protein AGMMS50267_09200 [Spirochaetia bacterium]|nr:hypothetical protein AGMMS50267_09200 [Spirochaetia bacterium]